jgi:hypothetical protein
VLKSVETLIKLFESHLIHLKEKYLTHSHEEIEECKDILVSLNIQREEINGNAKKNQNTDNAKRA